MLLPVAIHVICMSFIGHKEWRFVVYIIPIMNVLAALGLDSLYKSGTTVKPVVGSPSPRRNPVRSRRNTGADQDQRYVTGSPISPPRMVLSKLNPSYVPPPKPIVKPSAGYKLKFVYAIVFMAALSFVASLGMLFVSSLNYPGAEALAKLHGESKKGERCNVHIDTFSGKVVGARAHYVFVDIALFLIEW
jgi:alpha-1,6-mannosyltransferase